MERNLVMFGIGTPYLALAAVLALLGSFVAGNLHGHSAEKKTWEVALVKQQRDAQKLLADKTAEVAAKDAAFSELANKLDSDHAKAIETLDSTRADFSKRLRIAASGVCRNPPGSAETPNPGIGSGSSEGGDVGLGSLDLERVQQIRDGAMRLAAYAASCHAWAVKVGR